MILASWRALFLFLLSLAEVVQADLAWLGPPEPLRLVVWTGAVAGGLLAGEWLPRVASLDRGRRVRVRVALELGYAGLLVVGLLFVSGAPEPSVLRRAAAVAMMLQPVCLAVGYLRGDELPAVLNALVLATLSGLRGGLPAAGAVIAFVALVVPFLVFDHVHRMLAAHARHDVVPVGYALRESARLALPAAALVAVLLVLAPPRGVAGDVLDDAGPRARESILAAYRLLGVLGLIGGAGVYLATRLLPERAEREPPREEVVEPALAAEEPLPPGDRRPRLDLAGRRGRVLRAYFEVLVQAARLGRGRAPATTAREFARSLGGRDVVWRLTALFQAARYGPGEPTEDEARAAETAAGEVRSGLRPRPKARAAAPRA